MHIILITDYKQIQKDGKPLQWREWINDAVDAACIIKEYKSKGMKVERYQNQYKV
jgi:hypothetical protein